jgi:hypothetical protein
MLIALGMAFALPALTRADESLVATPTGVVAPAAWLQSTSAPGTSVLSGVWRSAADEMALTSEFDESVWGKNAVAIRTVQMIVRPNGDATLTVNRRVVDGRRRTVPGSASLEEVQLLLGLVEKTTNVRCELAVVVKKAERRYPGDPGADWPLEGLRVGVVRFTDDPGTLEVRFDTPEGRGSFWETLRRVPNKKPSTTT